MQAWPHWEDDDDFMLLNTHSEPVVFKLPQDIAARKWKVAVDTARPELPLDKEMVQNPSFKLEARSCVVLVH